MSRVVIIGSFLVCSMVFSGCYSLTPGGVQAGGEDPSSSQVAEVSIPFDDSAPRFVVAVEPFSSAKQTNVETTITGYNRCQNGNCAVTTAVRPLGNDVAAQLISALSKSGNISVLDFSALKKNNRGEYSAKLDKGERGPFLIRGTLTEFTENAQALEENRGASFGWLGLILGISGAVSGNSALGWTGAGIAAANPSFKAEHTKKTGMVSFDVQLINTRTMRVLTSHRVNGTFTAESARNGASLFGIGGNKAEFVQSVLGQAMRVAMNQAVEKIDADLKEKGH